MPAAAVLTIIAAVVVIVVLAVFLLTIARVLLGVNRQLEAVIASVGTIATKTEPVNGVVRSITGNLGSAADELSSLLESKVGADGAAELVASVDPLAETFAEEDRPMRHARVGEDELFGEQGQENSPPWSVPEPEDDEPIRYRRAHEPTAEPDAP